MWTRFMDMHSGGGTKENGFDFIFIEAPEHEARLIFYNRFGHNPERVSCTCCGDDYSISEHESLEQISGYDRHCAYVYFKNGVEMPVAPKWNIKSRSYGSGVTSGYVERQCESVRQYVRGAEDPTVWENYLNNEGKNSRYQSLKQFRKRKDVLIVNAADIKDSERKGSVPQQGYVYID